MMGYAEGLPFFPKKEEAYRVVERAGSARCHMSADSVFLCLLWNGERQVNLFETKVILGSK
jgi:hypothetical protein